MFKKLKSKLKKRKNRKLAIPKQSPAANLALSKLGLKADNRIDIRGIPKELWRKVFHNGCQAEFDKLVWDNYPGLRDFMARMPAGSSYKALGLANIQIIETDKLPYGFLSIWGEHDKVLAVFKVK